MEIRPVKNAADYEAAVAQIEQLCEADPGTEAGNRPELLVTLVEAFEEREFALPAPDPIEAIKYYMESRDLKRRDLEPFIGSRARVSEILNRSWRLSGRARQLGRTPTAFSTFAWLSFSISQHNRAHIFSSACITDSIGGFQCIRTSEAGFWPFSP